MRKPFYYTIRKTLKARWIKAQTGFSLAEVMIVAGLLGGLSLVLMQITKNQQQTLNYAESRSEELELYNRVRAILLQKEACEATFNGVSLGQTLSHIRSANGQNLLTVGNEYGSRALRLTSLRIRNDSVPSGGGLGTAKLEIITERLKMAVNKSPMTREITLQVKATSSSGAIQECFADTEGTILTSKEEMCTSLDGVFNSSDGTCTLNCSSNSPYAAVSTACLQNRIEDDLDQRWVNADGDTMTGNLNIQGGLHAENITAGQAVNAQTMSAATITATQVHATSVAASGHVSGQSLRAAQDICVGSNCRNFAAQSCAPGQMVERINADGTLTCRGIACPTNRYFEGFNASGNPICKAMPTGSCSTNQYVKEVRADGSIICANVPYHWGINCNAGYYIRSIASNGTPTCVQPESVYGKLCPTGQVLRGFNSSGVATCVSSDSVSGKTCPSGRVLRGFDSSGNPICENHYQDERYVRLSGSTMSGNLNMGDNSITNISDLSARRITISGAANDRWCRANTAGQVTCNYVSPGRVFSWVLAETSPANGYTSIEARCPTGTRRTGCSGYYNCVCFGSVQCDYQGVYPDYLESCRGHALQTTAGGCSDSRLYVTAICKYN